MFLLFYRTLGMSFWFLVSCLYGIMIGFMRPFDPESVQKVAHFLGKKMISFLGISYEVRGYEHFNSLPGVIVSNHQNNFDLYVLGSICPYKTVTLGKKELVYIPFFGLMYWLIGNILIDRSNKRKAKRSMEKVTESISQKGISVWIMPEGTRSRGRGLLPFKTGAFRTAIDAQKPIFPVAVSDYSQINLAKKVSARIIAEVLPPLSTVGLGREDVNVLKDRTYQLMKEKCQDLNKEVESYWTTKRE